MVSLLFILFSLSEGLWIILSLLFHLTIIIVIFGVFMINKSTEQDSLRDQFRKEIRRRQIQSIITQKRMLFFNSEKDQYENNRVTLQSLFDDLKSHSKNSNLDEKLSKLGNFLYKKQCLSRTSEQMGQHEMQKLCKQIVSTIFNRTLPCLSNHSDENMQSRIKCLTIVSNIVADSLAPHTDLISTITQGIKANYQNLSQQSELEACQIGWVIANCLCQRLNFKMQFDLQKDLQQILTVVQGLIMIENIQMIDLMYKSLKNFFNEVDLFFNPQNNQQQVQHFKIHRLIILQSTVNFNMNMKQGTALIPILSFIQGNIKYINSCNENLAKTICKKCCQLLYCSSSEKIMSATLGLLQNVLRQRQVVVFIVKDYFQIFRKCLMFQGIQIKLQTLRIIIYYFCRDEDITTFIARNKQLELILCELMKSVRDSDLLIQLMIASRVILQQTSKKCGLQTVTVIGQYLVQKSGDVGIYAAKFLNEFQLQATQMYMS